jgi:thiamine pyrophosphokinase
LTKVIALEIRGMKYELPSTNTLGVTIYPSNEFIKKEAKLYFREGMVATIQSKD